MSTVRLWCSVPPTLAFAADDAWGAEVADGPATADAASSPAPTKSIVTESMSRLCTETPFAECEPAQLPARRLRTRFAFRPVKRLLIEVVRSN
jgi:hypothetical protein